MWKAVLKGFGDILAVVRYGRFVCHCWWRSTVLTCRFWNCVSILLKVYLKKCLNGINTYHEWKSHMLSYSTCLSIFFIISQFVTIGIILSLKCWCELLIIYLSLKNPMYYCHNSQKYIFHSSKRFEKTAYALNPPPHRQNRITIYFQKTLKADGRMESSNLISIQISFASSKNIHVWNSCLTSSSVKLSYTCSSSLILFYCLLIYLWREQPWKRFTGQKNLTSTGNVDMSSNSFELWFLKYPVEWKELKSSEMPPSK